MTVWKVWRPPPVDEQFAAWRLEEPSGLRTLRTALLQVVTQHVDLDRVDLDDLAERLVIVATELAGNALRYSRPPMAVALLRAGRHLVLDVVDNEPQLPPVVEHRLPGTGGLGLQLTERLADDVGWYPTDAGKHVWAMFPIAAG
jgi:serine/threonine-protein kinase RsbW